MFKDLTEKDIDFIMSCYNDASLKSEEKELKIASLYEISQRTVRKWFQKLKLTKPNKKDNDIIIQAKNRILHKGNKIVIISSAQNATSVNRGLWQNMLAYAEYIGAEIAIIPIRYRNPTSIDCKKDDEWWSPEVVPYLSFNRQKLNSSVTLLGDVKTQPTNANPINGFEGLCGEGSCIIAHPRVQMKALPTLSNTPKMIFTTGSVTKSNYTDSRIGKLGDFHHTFGFCIVEIVSDTENYIRQVTALANGNFYDMDYYVSDGNVTRSSNKPAIILGDIHYPSIDKNVEKITFDNILQRFETKYIVMHDPCDIYSINHHEESDIVKKYQKSMENNDDVLSELNAFVEWMDKSFEDKSKIVIVKSNHSDFIEKWVKENTQLKNVQPKNLLAYMDFLHVMVKSKSDIGVLGQFILGRFPDVKVLGENESFKVLGWELGQHGHIGLGGSKGNSTQYRRLNSKIICGHSHSPVRQDGFLSVGTNSLLRMGYNVGLSNWVHADVIIHPDGKAQHLFLIGKNGEYSSI